MTENIRRKTLIVFGNIICFAWGGISIGWWIGYPLGHKIALEECRSHQLKVPFKE